jgi:hypothetical protein
VACTAKKRNASKDFVANSEGMRQFQRPRRRWEDNIKIVLKEIG